MKLANYDLENELDFETSDVWTLVCENPHQFVSLTENLFRQVKGEEGSWRLYDRGKPADIAKFVVFVCDYFSISLTDKKASSLLQDQIKKLAFDENHTVATHEILSALEKYAHLLSEDIDYPTSIGEVEFSQIAKIISIAFLDEAQNIVERLSDYATLLSRLTQTKLLVCVNLRGYLTEPELHDFFVHCINCGICLLCIESSFNKVLPDERVLVCDNDLCEFFPQIAE